MSQIPESARQLISGDLTFAEYFSGLSDEQLFRGDANLLASVLAVVPRRGLSVQEFEVVRCAARGLSSKEAAIELGIGWESERAVRKRVLRKLKARNMTHAVAVVLSACGLGLGGGEAVSTGSPRLLI